MVKNASRPGAVAMAFVLYVAISVGIFGVLVVGSPARVYIGYDTDPSVMMWFLTWWPHALTHNLNPFLTKVIWAPIGYNLAWATSMPGPSLLAYPITRSFGSVVSYNLLCLIAPALNATAAFLLCTRLSRRFLVAFTGGYIFGFSPFVLVHQLAGHLFLIFVPWVPLLLYLAMLFIERNMRSWHFIGMFALLATAQCLTATETFVTAAMMGSFTLLAATLILPATERAVSVVDTPEFFRTPRFTRYLDRNEIVLVLPNSADGNSCCGRPRQTCIFEWPEDTSGVFLQYSPKKRYRSYCNVGQSL
jgi:hypothetical protein